MPIVPIVMGGTNYKDFAPPKSFIDVNDFKSVEELTYYLQYLDMNDVKKKFLQKKYLDTNLFFFTGRVFRVF